MTGQSTLVAHRAGRGPKLVLLHGLPLDNRIWGPAKRMLENSLEVIAVDMPGFGDSPPPEAGVTLDHLIASVGSFLAEQVEGPYALLAHSMGGYVALGLQESGRLTSCTSMVLCATHARPDPAKKAEERIAAAEKLQAGEGSWFAGLQLKACNLQNHDFDALAVSVFGDNSRPLLAPLLKSLAVRPGSAAAAAAIRVPTLVLCGEEDEPFREGATELADLIPGSAMTWIPKAGHLLFLDAPERFAELVQIHLLPP